LFNIHLIQLLNVILMVQIMTDVMGVTWLKLDNGLLM
jgi:hypothetical protein